MFSTFMGGRAIFVCSDQMQTISRPVKCDRWQPNVPEHVWVEPRASVLYYVGNIVQANRRQPFRAHVGLADLFHDILVTRNVCRAAQRSGTEFVCSFEVNVVVTFLILSILCLQSFVCTNIRTQ